MDEPTQQITPAELPKFLYSLLRHATLISPERARDVQVGDIVVECSISKVDLTMVGVLTKIEDSGGGSTNYVVTSLVDGEEQRWINAVPRTVKIM